MSKDRDSQLIWESYFTKSEGIEDDFAEFADENSGTIWSAPEGFSDIDSVKRSIVEMPTQLQPFFRPDQEGSFLVISATDDFHEQAQAIDGDGMGGTTEYKLGNYLIGMEDGNFATYIKIAEPTKSSSLKLKRPPQA